MIDFRYHLVSLIAVFLALATGLVLGSTLVDDVVLKSTQRNADDRDEKNSELREQLLALQSQERSSASFVQTMAPKLLAGELADQRVVVVAAPGADDGQVDEVSTGVKQAGGTVTGSVTLDDTYIDKAKVGVLGGLTDTLAKSTKLDVPADAVPADRAGYLLANALISKDTAKVGESDDTSSGTLTAFEEAKFLSTKGDPQARASLAIVVGPAKKYQSKQAAAGNNAIMALATHLDQAGDGSVLAAPSDSAGPDGMVSALRGDDAVKQDVSTVDNLQAPPGRVVSVLALALDARGRPGQWGSGTGADSVAPTPATGSGKSP